MSIVTKKFDMAAIMRKAHAEARMIVRPGKYREVFALRLRQQWKNAKEALFWTEELRSQEGRVVNAPAEARRLAIFEIETKDRLTTADFSRLTELRSAA